MKKLSLLSLISLLFITTAYGQSTEYSIHFNSGLFKFNGQSHLSSFVSNAPNPPGSYVDPPFGNKTTWTYDFAAQVQRITKRKLVYGVQLGYELVQNQVKIGDVRSDFNNVITQATGHSTVKMGFIDLYPNVGKRFMIIPFDLDFRIGPDIGFNTISREKAIARLKPLTGTSPEITVDRRIHNPGIDFGLRTTLTLYYRHLGLSADYSYGLHNYYYSSYHRYEKFYSRFFRFGVVFRIK